MAPALSLLILAFAVSLDGFSVGAMYGLRKVRIPLVSVMIIACMSGVVIFGSMHIGLLVARFFSPEWAKIFGALILVGIGIWALYQMGRQKDEEEHAALRKPDADCGGDLLGDGNEDWAEVKRTVLSIELKRMGLIIQILKTPSAADVDGSGNISPSEAALLGLALSMDAFGAGIGAALIGFAPLVTAAVIALVSGSFLYTGLRIGLFYSNLVWLRRLTFLPGCILILIGFLKMM